MIISLDTETTGTDFFHGCRAFMVTMCDGDTNYWWMAEVNPFNRDVYWKDEDLDEIQQMIKKAEKIIFHNAKFDIRALEYMDIDIRPIWDKVEDTILAAHAINSYAADKKNNELGLKDLGIKYLDYWDDDENELAAAVQARRKVAKAEGWDVGKHYHPHHPAMKATYKQDYWLCPEECTKYGLGDAERTWLLWRIMKRHMISEDLYEGYKTRRNLLRIAYEMEDFGMYMYKEKAEAYVAEKTAKAEAYRLKLKELSGIRYKLDIHKNEHLIDLLHHRLKIPVAFRTDKTEAPQITKDSLEFYIDQGRKSKDKRIVDTINLLAKCKQAHKDIADVKGYLSWTDDNSRIHSTCWITGTRETRQSFTDPAIQTIKKSLRRYYGPPPGSIVVNYDLVNIELRIWAYDTGNPVLIKAFEEGKSVHMIIAKIIAPLAVKEAPIPEWRQRYQCLLDGNVDGFKKANPDDPFDEEDSDVYTDLKSGTFGRIYGATNLTTNQTYFNTKSKTPPDACALIDSQLPGVGDYARKQIQSVLDNYARYGVCAIRAMGGYRLDVPSSELQKACNYRVQGTAGWITTLAMLEVDKCHAYRTSGARMIQQVHDSLAIEIKIQPGLMKIITGIQDAIEEAGCTIIPTCRASYKIAVHPSDVDRPELIGIK